MEIEIATRPIGGSFIAYLKSRPDIHNHGKSADEARKKLIDSRPDIFDKKVEEKPQ